MPRADLIRFVTGNRHPPYGNRSGVFAAALALCHEQPDQRELRALLDWFNDHLARPGRFAASRRPHGARTAVCWVRATALEHVARLRRVAALVEEAGIAVDELRTTRPGYVLYEDGDQVVALPFTDTPS